MILAEDLRKAVLQAAIQGTIVDQRIEEGTGEELYAKIQEEKARLIRQGTINKGKTLPKVTDDEIPFDIPESWKWARFHDVALSSSTGPFGTMLHKDEYVIGGIPVINPTNLVDGVIVPDNKVTVSDETARRLKSYKLSTNDLILARRGEMGRCAIVSQNEDGWLCGTGSFFVRLSEEIYKPYVYLLFQTPYVRTRLSGDSVGTTMGNLNQKILSTMVIPLPPKEEQRRIVQTVNETLDAIKDYAVAEQELVALQAAFPDDMWKSILQYAIQGKLVEQRLEEGTGDDLYQQIQTEKDELIKAGKIKKEKPLREIMDDEIPFDIPETWKWVRFSDVILSDIGGGTPDKSNKRYWNGTIPWMSVKDFSGAVDGVVHDTIDHISQLGVDNSATNVIDETAIIICTRMGLGKTARVSRPTAINQDLRAIWLSSHINQSYFLMYYSSLRIDGFGTTVKGIKRNELMAKLLPLPPYAEQQRIVKRLDQILPLIEDLKGAK